MSRLWTSNKKSLTFQAQGKSDLFLCKVYLHNFVGMPFASLLLFKFPATGAKRRPIGSETAVAGTLLPGINLIC